MVGLHLPFAIKCSESDRGNLRTIVELLKKTKVLSLDRMKTTWPILHLLNMHWRTFPKLTGIRLEFQEEYFERFMEMPADFLANITELGLNEVTYNKDKNKFITATRNIILKTRKLKYLRISPYGQPNSWIELIAECAPVL